MGWQRLSRRIERRRDSDFRAPGGRGRRVRRADFATRLQTGHAVCPGARDHRRRTRPAFRSRRDRCLSGRFRRFRRDRRPVQRRRRGASATMSPEQDKPAAAPKGMPAAAAALRLVLIYAAFAALWILLSDKALEWLFSDPAQIIRISLFKGWLFVAVTSLLLYGLVRRLLGQALELSLREQAAHDEYVRSQQLLAAIVDGSTDSIFAKDLAGRYLLFNRETARIT